MPLTGEMLDYLAEWLREQINADLRAMTAGGENGWADLHGKLHIIDDYEQAAKLAATPGPNQPRWATARWTLGRVLRHLSMAYTRRDGWLPVWRIE